MEKLSLLMALMVVGCGSVTSCIVPVPCGQSDGICCRSKCPENWVGFRGSCYFFSNEIGKSFVESQKSCQSRRADLVTIEDEEEAQFLMTQIGYLKNTVIFETEEEKQKGPWVGLVDFAIEGLFTTLYGEVPEYDVFQRNQPDGGRSQNCVAIVYADMPYCDDFSCDNTRSYICEKDPDCDAAVQPVPDE